MVGGRPAIDEGGRLAMGEGGSLTIGEGETSNGGRMVDK